MHHVFRMKQLVSVFFLGICCYVSDYPYALSILDLLLQLRIPFDCPNYLDQNHRIIWVKAGVT